MHVTGGRGALPRICAAQGRANGAKHRMCGSGRLRHSHFVAVQSLLRAKVQGKHPVCPFAAMRLTLVQQSWFADALGATDEHAANGADPVLAGSTAPPGRNSPTAEPARARLRPTRPTP